MSTQERAFRGVWIPASVWLNDTLSLQEKVMLIEIDSLQHPERGCFKTNKKLAEFFGLSTGRVSQIIRSLQEKGFVRVEHIRKGKQIIERRIYMQVALETPAPGVKDTKQGCLENTVNPVKHSKQGCLENAQERGPGVRGSGVGGQGEKPLVSSGDVTAVFEFWKTQMGKTSTAKLDTKRCGKIKSALATYGLALVQQAIIGCTLSAHHMGQNTSNKRYDDIELILRDATHVEQFLGYYARKPTNISLYDHRPRPKHTGLDQANSAGLHQRADGAYSL